MGKSVRAKKAKKADFKKIKMKVGKKLKKAQNETKTDFKARKIILKEQLALKSTQVLVTKKQHDIKELLSRLTYHNVYVRQDGINGLRELINRYEPKLLMPHLSTFVTRVAPCILDSDPLIRNAATKYMEALIIKMGPSIEPYFIILATHLSCAMVHLNVGVQGDSLQLMKVLIKHTPKLVARHANTVLNNFINLIARKTVVVGSVPPVVCDTISTKTEEVWLFSDTKKLEQFTDTVIRLLMQLWMEVDAGNINDTSAGGNAINEEGVETLSCIVNIIMHIWRITQICTQEHPKKCSWLKGHFKSDFMKRIMWGFPFYCQVTPLPSKKRKKNKEADQNRQDEAEKRNLKHCDDLNVLLALFGTQMLFKSHRTKSVNFLSKLLRDGNRDGQYNMSAVIRIIRELLPPSAKAEIQTIINAAHTCFIRLHPLKKERSLLLELLLETTDMNHEFMWSYPSVKQWVEDIVKDLVAGEVRESLLQAAIDLRLRDTTNIKSLLLCEREKISEAIKTKGINGLTAAQVDKKLSFLLKD